MKKKLKVLVTGGAGFIGSNVCLRLLNKGYEVICIDNLSTGSKSNMTEFLFNPLFHFIVHDITSPISISGIDVIIHCALPDMRDPLHFLKTCAYGTFTVAGIARRNNARLVCLSSSDIYGDSCLPLEETNCLILNPSSMTFGVNFMETVLNNYSSLDVRILRMFDVYGPKMNKESYLYSFLEDLVNNKNIESPVSPFQIINACYIGDVVDAICSTMERASFKRNFPMNVGPIENITLENFLNTAKDMIGSKSEIKYTSLISDNDIIKPKHY